MIKIALVGYGKMGKAIEKIALNKSHEISFRIDKNSISDLDKISKENTDVIIEFTGPESAFHNLERLLPTGIPIVSGSTGWTDKLEYARALCLEYNNAFLWASNFSVGVNLFFEINKRLAEMMSKYKEYTPSIEEVHHTQKLDAPSGTAITTAEGILKYYKDLEGWKLEEGEQQESSDHLYIKSIREDPAPGTHTVTYRSAIDDIQLQHTAHSREGFALGAVIAAEFIVDKKGVFTMQDVLFEG